VRSEDHAAGRCGSARAWIPACPAGALLAVRLPAPPETSPRLLVIVRTEMAAASWGGHHWVEDGPR